MTGSGQTLALLELDGYNPTDIAKYESQFGLPSTPLQNVSFSVFTAAFVVPVCPLWQRRVGHDPPGGCLVTGCGSVLIPPWI